MTIKYTVTLCYDLENIQQIVFHSGLRHNGFEANLGSGTFPVETLDFAAASKLEWSGWRGQGLPGDTHCFEEGRQN